MTRAVRLAGTPALLAALLLVAAFLLAVLPLPAQAASAPGVASPATASPTAVTPAETVADDAPPLAVDVITITPDYLQAGETVTITVDVSNNTDAPIAAPQVDVLAQEWTPNTRISLTRWLDPERYGATLLVLSQQISDLAPHATATVSLTFPADDLGVTGWGARGLEVRVSDPSGAVDADAERTWVTWWDGSTVSPTPLTVLSPVTATLTELTASTPNLSRVAAVLGQAGAAVVTALIDPAVIEAGDPNAPATVAAQVAAQEVGSAGVIAYGNADAVALVGVHRPGVYEGAVARSVAEFTSLGIDAESLVWPYLSPDRAAAAAIGALDGVILLPADAIPDYGSATLTPSARATMDGANALVVDGGLAAALDGTVSADGATYALTESQVQQYLLATTSVVTRERPADPRPLVALLPIDDDARHADALAALSEVPWVAPTSLADLLALPADPLEVDPALLPSEDPDPSSGVTVSLLGEAESDQEALAALGALVAEPAALVGNYTYQLAGIPSAVWRAAPQDRAARVAEVSDRIASLRESVSVQVGSTITMVSESSNFPVAVSNTLPQEVTVQVSIVPSDRRMQQVAPQTITIPPGTEVQADIPVTGAGIGTFTVNVYLRAPNGEQLTAPTPVRVQLLASLENWVMISVLVLGGASFVFGIVRTARRNKRTGRAAEIEAAAEQLDAMAEAEK